MTIEYLENYIIENYYPKSGGHNYKFKEILFLWKCDWDKSKSIDTLYIPKELKKQYSILLSEIRDQKIDELLK